MERNYKEDQANEIEALESIYCDDIESECWRLFYRKCLLFWLNCVYCVCFFDCMFFCTVLSTAPHKFKILISTEEYNRETETDGLACQLQFTYTEKYPDTEPVVEIEDETNFEDDYNRELLENISATVS